MYYGNVDWQIWGSKIVKCSVGSAAGWRWARCLNVPNKQLVSEEELSHAQQKPTYLGGTRLTDKQRKIDYLWNFYLYSISTQEKWILNSAQHNTKLRSFFLFNGNIYLPLLLREGEAHHFSFCSLIMEEFARRPYFCTLRTYLLSRYWTAILSPSLAAPHIGN